jgi:hypothetical protein
VASHYGAGDQAGALNKVGPAEVLEAVQLVRHRRVYDLAHELHADVPAFPGRTFRLPAQGHATLTVRATARS